MELTEPGKVRSCDPDSSVPSFRTRVVLRLGSETERGEGRTVHDVLIVAV